MMNNSNFIFDNFINIVLVLIIGIGICSIGYLVSQIAIQIKIQKKPQEKDIPLTLPPRQNMGVFTHAEEIIESVPMSVNAVQFEEKIEKFSEKTQEFPEKTEELPVIETSSISLAHLHFLAYAGQSSNRVEIIVQDKTTLGRGKENDILIKDDFVSKYHITIFHEQGKMWIKDHDTTNGTFINGVKVASEEKTYVSDDAEVRIGQTEFVIKKCNY